MFYQLNDLILTNELQFQYFFSFKEKSEYQNIHQFDQKTSEEEFNKKIVDTKREHEEEGKF